MNELKTMCPAIAPFDRKSIFYTKIEADALYLTSRIYRRGLFCEIAYVG